MAAAHERNPSVVLFPITDIIVDREVRQRTTLDKDIDQLADDIELTGLIHPITLRREPYGKLVAGERRLEAHKRKGWTHIRAQFLEDLSEVAAYRVELVENLKRKNLNWQDEVRAVGVYHALRKQTVGEQWTIKGTASDLSMSDSTVQRYLIVAKEMQRDEEIMGCQTFDGAFNLIKGKAERARAAATNRGFDIVAATPIIAAGATKEEKAAAIQTLIAKGGLDAPADNGKLESDIQLIEAGALARASLDATADREAASANLPSPIITASFIDWAESYEGSPFDVLHVDFPYGKDYQGSNTRRTGRAHICDAYADSPDVFWELVEALLTWQDKLAYPVAHMLFWFDMQYYQAVLDTFRNAGWKDVQPFPLIWHKPYQGVAADTKRRPRHTYETALLFSRGDRKLVRLDQDVFVGRVDEKLHMNQKAQDMLKQFLSMLVDEHTAVFDPTCGSGSALAVAKALGARRYLGIELDATNADVARFLLNRDGGSNA